MPVGEHGGQGQADRGLLAQQRDGDAVDESGEGAGEAGRVLGADGHVRGSSGSVGRDAGAGGAAGGQGPVQVTSSAACASSAPWVV